MYVNIILGSATNATDYIELDLILGIVYRWFMHNV